MRVLPVLFIFFIFLNCFYQQQEDESKITEECMIAPLPIYQKYFYDDNKNIFGINQEGLTKLSVLDNEGNTIDISDFYSVDGKLYFVIKTMIDSGEVDENENPIMEELTTYYEQSAGVITEVESIPERPVQGRKQLVNNEFTIVDNTYEGQDVSDLQNIAIESGIERFLLLNAYCYIQGVGLWFYVKEGREPVRPDEGLYFWPVDKPSVSRIKEKGEIW